MVGLIQEKLANAGSENGFHIPFMSFWHTSKPGNRGVAIALRKIGFAKRKVRFRPFWFEARRFPKLAQTNIVISGKQTANVVFKRIKAQRTLAFREVCK